MQIVKTLQDGKAIDVKVNADSWQDAYDHIVEKTIESIATQTFYHEKFIIFNEDGGVERTFEPDLTSFGVLEDED